MKNESIKSNINIPNAVTFFRLVGAIALIFIKPFSLWFYIVFLLCGASDAIDGYLARRMNCSTEFGAKLDSVSDLTFYSVMLLKVFPHLWANLPRYVFVFAGLVIFTRIVIYIYVGLRHHRFSSLHTYGNKITSFSLFISPFVAPTFLLYYFSMAVCIFGGIASVEELIIHIISKEYDPRLRTILMMIKR